ncbi:aminoacyl-tRNA hydrolase [bacterium]|nr:aminoacyl-tRNA hydrolase [bacterium]
MFLIVGLGNPGKEYRKTRHNVGFLVLSKFHKKNNFSKFILSKKHNCLLSKGEVLEKQILLAKPQTFMNNSGKAIKSILQYTKTPLTNLIIVHDDIDLPLGKIKISKNRGSAGHKGVQSIIDNLGTKDFTRIRIGIAPPKKIERIDKFVLENFSNKEKKILNKTIETTCELLPDIVANIKIKN